MMTCTAKELCAATGGTLVQDGEGFSCVSTDSRRVEQGCLFIPLVGERFDGHTYLTGICKADRLDEFIADPSVRSGNAEEDGGFLRIGVG